MIVKWFKIWKSLKAATIELKQEPNAISREHSQHRKMFMPIDWDWEVHRGGILT